MSISVHFLCNSPVVSFYLNFLQFTLISQTLLLSSQLTDFEISFEQGIDLSLYVEPKHSF